MATNLKLVTNVTPRPFLTIVKELQLDSIAVPGKRKTKLTSKGGQPPIPVAANGGSIPESSRNSTLASLAGTMRRRGMTETAIAAALHAENLARCTPPLDQQEVDSIATSMMRYAASDIGDLFKSLTDAGNADRFARRYAGRVIYVPGLAWLIWTGLQWRRDNTGHIMELAKQLVRSIYLEGTALDDDDARIAVAKHAKASQQAQRLKAMLELARSCPELVVPSSQLDAHDLLLGVANGVINLRTGKLQAAKPDDYITRHIPVVFDAKATCPLFLKFMDKVTQANKPLICYLQRVIGYCLTGLTTEQCLFFLYGMGANGKSTFLNLIKELLGQFLACQTPSETLMARKNSGATNDIARLNGMRVVIANEVEDGSLLAESLVKQLTGGDTVTARFLYGEFTEFLPKLKLLIAGNHKPTIRGRDEGIWRRMRLVPFDATIPPAQRDKKLPVKLSAELPGILNWAIRGCLDWQKKGLAEPLVITNAVKSYREEMDLLAAWMNDCCVTGPQFEWPSRKAYTSYALWAEGGGYKPMSEGMFSRDLEITFKKIKRKDANYFVGINGKLGPH